MDEDHRLLVLLQREGLEVLLPGAGEPLPGLEELGALPVLGDALQGQLRGYVDENSGGGPQQLGAGAVDLYHPLQRKVHALVGV